MLTVNGFWLYDKTTFVLTQRCCYVLGLNKIDLTVLCVTACNYYVCLLQKRWNLYKATSSTCFTYMLVKYFSGFSGFKTRKEITQQTIICTLDGCTWTVSVVTAKNKAIILNITLYSCIYIYVCVVYACMVNETYHKHLSPNSGQEWLHTYVWHLKNCSM